MAPDVLRYGQDAALGIGRRGRIEQDRGVGAAGLVALFILRDIDRDLSPAEQANLANAIRADVVDVLASGA